MVVDSPTSSPVKITVTSSGGSQSMGLTSPVPRHSILNNPNSPINGRGLRSSGGGENRRASSSGGRYLSFSKDGTDGSVAYTVHISSTPDNRVLSESQNSLLEASKSRGENPV
ncbi:Cellulose synthase-like protein D5 [Forsythia ovata]|uniref:Cellulose synthase-like protein D5 n=1 Tax=Forsythia ovata TaxID=205694 RepID=A0ABD1NWX1_9LAMI